VAIRGNPWQSVAICGNLWQSVAICGNLWQSVAIRGTLIEIGFGSNNLLFTNVIRCNPSLRSIEKSPSQLQWLRLEVKTGG